MKKVFLAFLLIFLFTFSVKGEESRNSFLHVGMNTFFYMLAGFNIGYEHSLNNNISISIDAGTFFGTYPYAATTVRWYPWANIFFVGLGPGAWLYPNPTFFISPTIGWKILLGQQGRWFVMPNLAGHVRIPPFGSFYNSIVRLTLSVGFNW